MKKLLMITMSVLGFTAVMTAQDIADNAIGLRLGDSDGFGAEISYQRAIGGDNNRLEFDLGWRNGNDRRVDYDGFKLTGIYQWVWNIDGGFNWYAGPAAGIANYSYDYLDNENKRFDDSETFIFIGGDIGIEYNFDIPLLISLDFRPEFGLGNDNSSNFGNGNFDNNDLDFDIALGIRYQF